MTGSQEMAASDGAGVPTITDVAAMAGVSISTVSRALSHPEQVAPRTREKIQSVVDELGYARRASIPPQNGTATGIVAVVVPEIADPFFLNIIRETQIQLKAAGLAQLLFDTDDSSEIELASLERFRKMTDGVLFVASRMTDDQLRAAASSMPLVAINRQAAGVACVAVDTPVASVQALEHLVSLGHRKIGYISGPLTSWSSEMRFRAIEQRGIELNISVTRIGAFQARMASGAAAADMAINAGVTACICFGDLIAIGMLQRLHDRGVDVPKEFSIIGCDDIFGSSFCSPPLTTLTSSVAKLARVSVRMLLNQIKRPKNWEVPQAVIVPAYLTVRKSTGEVAEVPEQNLVRT